MLQLAVHMIIISTICMVWGLMILLAAKKIKPGNNFWIRSTAGFYCFLYFAGLITLSFISSWLCLFLPMRFSYLLLFSIVPLLFLISKRKAAVELLKMFPLKLNLSLVEVSFILVCLAACFIPGVLKPLNSDTQIYHVQIIRWFNEYGTVPGIANLFPRFGLGSNWFNLIAMFRIPYFSYENLTWCTKIMEKIWKKSRKVLKEKVAFTISIIQYLLSPKVESIKIDDETIRKKMKKNIYSCSRY